VFGKGKGDIMSSTSFKKSLSRDGLAFPFLVYLLKRRLETRKSGL